MKIQGINKNKQSGFTLIELVVVIVILGILAATAVPRFADLTTNANTAVAQGLLGAITSSAAIQLAAADPIGKPKTFAVIIAQTDFSNVPADTDIIAGTNATGGPVTISPSGVTAGAIICDAGHSVITVNVGTSSATGTLSESLCEG